MGLRQTILKPIAAVAGANARRQGRALTLACHNAPAAQDALLQRLLATFGESDFSRDHDLASVKTYDDFRKAVPVAGYDYVKPYIDRMRNGDFSAMLNPGEKPLMFSMTSGSTGEPKYIPVTQTFLEDIRRGFNIWGISTLNQHRKGWLKPIVQLTSSMHEETSPGGTPCGAISGLLAATQKRIVHRMYVVPRWVADIHAPETKYYASLLHSIGHDVGFITTANPSSTIKLIDAGLNYPEQLIRDLADGTCTPPEPLPADLQAQFRQRKQPRLARRLQRLLDTYGGLRPKHYWDIAFLGNWTGGTLGLYLPHLEILFGKVPVHDIGLLASEGRFSLPEDPFTPAGKADIIGNFLEFIPVEHRQEENPPTLRCHELEVGKEYILVFSNWTGLMRYNLDDCIRVIGFEGGAPIYEFLSRGLRTTSLTGEKLTEHQAVEAMQRATDILGTTIERFTLQPRFDDPPFYQLRCETRSVALTKAFDKVLSELNIEYESKRKSQRLGPVQLTSVPIGTFEREERAAIAARRGRSEQYKHQYLLTDIMNVH